MTEERIREQYDVLSIPLNANMTDEAYYFDANVIIIGQIPIDVQCRINDVGHEQLNLAVFRRINMRIKVLYLTTTTTSTTPLIIFSSKSVTVETAGFGSRAVLIDSSLIEYDARDVADVSVLATATQIVAAESEVTGEVDTTGYNKFVGWIVANQNITIHVHTYIATGGTAREIDTIDVASGVETGFEIPVVAAIMEITFENTAGADTTTCEKEVRLSSGA